MRANGTYCPIPVRCRSLVTALLNEGIFKVLEIVSVPWEEKSRKVDLSFGLEDNGGTDNTERTLIFRSICK